MRGEVFNAAGIGLIVLGAGVFAAGRVLLHFKIRDWKRRYRNLEEGEEELG